MYSFGPSTSRFEDYRLGATAGMVLAAYVGFFFILYWLMQPSISANPGLAAYRPPPKTVVRYADSPWVPPPPSEVLPIRAEAEPAPEAARAASPRSRRKRQRSKRHGQVPARRAPFNSKQIRSGAAMLRPARSVPAPGSDPHSLQSAERRQRMMTSAQQWDVG